VGGGSHNTSSSAFATVSGGNGNTNGGDYATVSGGEGNSATASYGTVPGGAQAAARSFGQLAYASGAFDAGGDAQTSVYVCRGTTTNATQTELFLDGAAEQMVVSTNTTWSFDILITGRASGGNSAAYQIRGAIKNNGGTTSLVGSPSKTVLAEDVPAWDASLVADNANAALAVMVTGAAGTDIRWVASVRTVEVTY
jgi:hypothetical protein